MLRRTFSKRAVTSFSVVRRGFRVDSSAPHRPTTLVQSRAATSAAAIESFAQQAKLLEDSLFGNNRQWKEKMEAENPGYFHRLAQQQAPKLLWIGCSDSRVPANTITGLLPGEVFVHRNIANCVVHSDINCMSVMQFAVEILKVEHIIVCGHYGCAGVRAALHRNQLGLLDYWIRNIKDVAYWHAKDLVGLDEKVQTDRLTELNVKTGVRNVTHSTVVMDAWRRGQPLAVHGWVYAVEDGLLRSLVPPIAAPQQRDDVFFVDPPRNAAV